MTLPLFPALDLAKPGLPHTASGGERLLDLFLACLAEAREVT